MFNNILLAVDGSPHSNRAADALIKLRSGRQDLCSVILFHVVPEIDRRYLENTGVDFDAIMQREGEKQIETVANQLQAAGIQFKTLIETGEPAKEICLQAKIAKHDLIIMGSRGLGTFNEVLLGSVCHTVLHHATCPVLIVK